MIALEEKRPLTLDKQHFAGTSLHSSCAYYDISPTNMMITSGVDIEPTPATATTRYATSEI